MKPLSRILSSLRNQLVPRHHESRDIFLRVANITRGMVIANRMEVADTSPKRNKGLLGRSSFATGEALWIVPCDSVHTFGMRFPIDLIYLDRNNRIKKLCFEVPAWRVSACLAAHSIIELPAGTIRDTGTRVGDILEFSAATLVTDDTEVM
jgi:hypothetical protein